MKVHREEDGRFVVSLARGDSIRECIEGLAREHGIGAARVTGIGAVEDPRLGCFDLPSKTYDERVFEGIWELLTLNGNLSLAGGEPLLHAHVTLSGHDYRAFGGHLYDARVGVVAELFVEPYPTPLSRARNDEIGLMRWEPGS